MAHHQCEAGKVSSRKDNYSRLQHRATFPGYRAATEGAALAALGRGLSFSPRFSAVRKRWLRCLSRFNGFLRLNRKTVKAKS